MRMCATGMRVMQTGVSACTYVLSTERRQQESERRARRVFAAVATLPLLPN